MSRKFRIGFGIVVAIAVVGSGGYWLIWYLSAQSTQSLVEDWAAAQRVSGYEISYQDINVTGFPGSATLTIDGLEIGNPSDTLAWRWTLDRVHIMAGGARSQDIAISVPGTQSVTYQIGGEGRTAQFTANRFRLDLSTREDGGLGRLTLDLSGFTLQRPQEGPPVTARRVQFQVSLGEGTGVLPLGTEATMLFDTLVLPEHRNGPMGNTVDLLEAKVRLLTYVSSLDVPKALEHWRERGGKLIISDSHLRWAGLNAQAKGSIQLDQAFRPIGLLKTQIADFTPTLEAFWAAGRFDTVAMNALVAALEDIREVENVGIVPYEIRLEDGIVRVVDILGRTVEGATLGTVAPIFPFPLLPE